MIRYRCTGATTARLSRTLARVRATLAASTALTVAGGAGPCGAAGSMSHHAQAAPVTASVAVSSPAARRPLIRSYGSTPSAHLACSPPAELEAALDAHQDRLLPARDHP